MPNLLQGGVQLRDFDDIDATRDAIFHNTKTAIQKLPPISNQRYTLELADVDYSGPEKYSRADEHQALLSGRSLGRRLVGTWNLKDNTTQKIQDTRRGTLANVPYMTSLGTFINNGNDYGIANQLRLRPGIYAREKENGELECFHRETLVWTEHGEIPIGDIVEQQLRIRVWSYDFELDQFVLRPVTNWYRNPVRSGLGKAEFSLNSLSPVSRRGPNKQRTWVTPSHELLTRDGRKIPVAACSEFLTVEDRPSSAQEQVILGSLLGDGYISPEGIFQEGHSEEQRQYLEFKTAVLGEFAADVTVGQTSGFGEVRPCIRFHSKQWAYLRELRNLCYPDGEKIVDQRWLDRIDARGLAFWFCDDGSTVRAKNQHGQTSCAVVVLATDGFCSESIDVLLRWLRDRWGFDAGTTRNSNSYGDRDLGWAITLNGDDAENFLDLVAPYVHSSLHYKLGERPISHHCSGCRKEIGSRQRFCNRCVLAACTAAPPSDFVGPAWLYRDRNRNRASLRFGSRKNVDQLLATGEIPPDDHRAKAWDVRAVIAGSRVSALADDCLPVRTLSRVAFEFETDPTKLDAKCRTRFAYDITVDGTHNYFANGMLVGNSHVNVAKGFGHRYYLDPATGVFRIQLAQSRMPLLPLLKALGAHDDQIRSVWGNKLWTANAHKLDPTVTRKIYQKLYTNKDVPEDGASMNEAIQKAFNEIELDPDVMHRTLGMRADKLTPDVILGATNKLLHIFNGTATTDDRDAMHYQKVMGPEDLFADSANMARNTLRQMFWKVTNDGSLRRLGPGVLDKSIRSTLMDSGLGSPLEEVNPLEILDFRSRVSRMGRGGIPSTDSTPEDARNVHPSQLGYVDLVVTPESEKIGVDGRLTIQSKKGSDNRLYSRFKDAKTGEVHWMSPQDVADKVVAFPREMQSNEPYVRALDHGKMRFVPREKVDVELNHMTEAFGPLANLVPLKMSAAQQRVSMGSRMLTQALALHAGEAPHVQAGIPGEDSSFEQKYGRSLGAVHSDTGGTVVGVTPSEIKVKGPDGKIQSHELYNNRLFNRKSYLHNTPLVQVGQAIQPGGILAKSNYTDNAGTLALGLNARVAYLSNGKNHNDAVVMSESFANRMTSEHAYQHTLDKEAGVTANKNKFMSIYPTKYTKAQLSNFDEDGVIKPGTPVNYQEPLILAVKESTVGPRLGRRRSSFREADVTWDHHSPGVVTDVIKTKAGINVVVKGQQRMQIADKLAGLYGDKSTVSEILPDHKMPVDAQGRPIELLLDPAAVISRGNPVQAAMTVLGKIAERTGKPYKLTDFDNITDVRKFAEDEAHKYGMSSREDLIDPETGQTIPGVLTGSRYILKLHHLAESKAQSRGIGGYSSDGAPAKGGPSGAKRVGLLNLNALLSHGAFNVARDAKVVRGQQSPDNWRQFMSGYSAPQAEIPHVYEKFLAELQGMGIRPLKVGSRMNALAMTDKDIDTLASGNEITNADTVDWHVDRLTPIKGGLFDEGATGGHGGCFHESVQIWTNRGMLAIGDIVKQQLAVSVWSFNFSTNAFELKPVTNWFKNRSAEGIGRAKFVSCGRLASRFSRYNPTTLWGTRTHQVYDITGDKHDLADARSLVVVAEQLSYSQEQLLYGGLLGDLFISPYGVLSLTHARRQRDYLCYKTAAFGSLAAPVHDYTDTSDNCVREKSQRYVHAHAKFREARAMVYIDGRKTLSSAWLNKIDALGLAIWILDDGNTNLAAGKNTVNVSIATHCFSQHEIQQLQAWLLSRWGLESFTTRDNAKYGDRDCGWMIVVSGQFAEQLLDTIAPYVPTSMQYKLGGISRTAACRRCCKQITPARRICNACLELEAAACEGSKLPKHIRRLFGSSVAVRELLVAGGFPPDTCRFAERRAARMAIAGTAVTAVIADTHMPLLLEQQPCEFLWQTGASWERLTTVYDIEVADNHNYFANGVLVSNSKWSFIRLHEPMLNPVMEDPVKKLLGLTQGQFEDIVAGKASPISLPKGGAGPVVNGNTGPKALASALASIDLDKEIARASFAIAGTKKTARNAAIQRQGFLKAAKSAGIHPKDWMLSRVPVLPPIFRPVSVMQGNNTPLIADPNYTYRDLIEANDALKTLSGQVDDVSDERLAVYNAFKAVTGMGDPIKQQTVDQKVKGILKNLTGSSPKWGCYDEKTEILTQRGWIYFADLTSEDIVATLNPVTGAFEWQQPTAIQKYRYIGELLQFKHGKFLDLLLTPNHRNWTRTRRLGLDGDNLDAGWEFETAVATFTSNNRKWFRTAANTWRGHRLRPKWLPRSCSLAQFATFVGWWTAEGWLGDRKLDTAQIIQSESRPDYCNQIEAAVTSLGLPYSVGTYMRGSPGKEKPCRQWSIRSADLAAWLTKNVGRGASTKSLSWKVRDWDMSLLEAFFKSYQCGDGGKRHIAKRNNGGGTHKNSSQINASHRKCHTTSLALIGQVQEIACKLGMTVRYAKLKRNRKTTFKSNHPLYRGGVCGSRFVVTEQSWQKEIVNYDGYVHCCTVPNGIVYVRRNGKPVFSGNSMQRKLLGSTVDLVGRAVIIPNPDLDMDEIGVPIEEAWTLYKPFVIRRLVRRGMKHMQALDEVERQTPLAKKLMQDEMGERPMLADRAPVLHRYGVMAFRPVLVQGKGLQIHPLVEGGLGADYDGDAMQFHVPQDAAAVREAYDKMLPSRNLISPATFKVHQVPSQNYVSGMFQATTTRNDRPPRVFRNKTDVMEAWRQGKIHVGDPIQVLEP